MEAALAQTTLSRDEARSLTDEVRSHGERLWRGLVELYEGKAHLALGYESWETFFRTEFGQSSSHGYRLLDAGRVVRALEESFPHGGMNVKQAVELAPLKDDPEALREAWTEVIETYDKPTAADVRAVVQQRQPMSKKAEMNANAEHRRIYSGLSGIEGYTKGLAGLKIDRAMAVATPEDVATWIGLARSARTQLLQLMQALEGKT